MHGLQAVMTRRERGGRSRVRACAGGMHGFTLIELMVVVAVIAILAAVAYPSYTSHLAKGRRAAAQSYLMDLAQKQAQYLLDKRAYAPTEAALGATAPTEVNTYYTIAVSVDAGPPPTFQLSATPRAGTAQANDGILGIDQAGTKTPSDKW